MPRAIEASRMGAAAGLALALVLAACGPEGPQCLGEGEPDFTLFAQLLDADVDEGAEIPVCPATQGGIVTMVDMDIAGVTEDQITSVRAWITADGRGIVADSTYTGSVFTQLTTCRETGTLGVTNLPIVYSDGNAPADLDGLGGTLYVDLRGDAPVSRELSVTFRAIGGC